MFFVWLMLYGIVMLLSRRFAALTPWAVPTGLLISTIALVGWLVWQQKRNVFYCKKLSFTCWKKQLFFVPYLLPVAYHLLRFGWQLPALPEILTVFLAVVLEEVLFRDLLLRALCKKNLLIGCLLTSLLFAAAHFLNLGTGTEPVYVLLQAVYALAIGLALCAVAISSESLLPCIGIHFLINITAGDSYGTPPQADPLFWVCVLTCFICGFWNILSEQNERNKERAFL